MPSPIGHALAGATIAWVAESLRKEPRDGRFRTALLASCVGLALAPDLDFVYPKVHRMMSHSLVAVALTGLIAAFIARRAQVKHAWQVMFLCGLAYASHLVLDWLGNDSKLPAGVQVLWPFSDTWYISSWGVFRATHLQGFFLPKTMMSNSFAVLQEFVLLSPIAFSAWRLQRNRRATAPRNIPEDVHY